MFLFNTFIPFYIFCALYVLGITTDLISTKIAISKGLREGNPVLSKFKNPLLVSAIVSLATVIFAVVATKIEHTTLHASIFCLVFALYRIGLTVWNISRIRKASNSPRTSIN